MYWVLFVLVFVPFLIIAPVKVFGKKNIKKGQKYIVVCNHKSFFDPIILDLKLRRKIRFIAKKELWKGKEKSYLFDNVLGCIPVDRSKGLTLSATKEIYNLLNSNQSLGLFPEGKRYADTEHDISVKNGACMFAIKTKTPILPCFFVKHPRFFRFNRLLIGKPFELSEFYGKKLNKETLNSASEIIIQKLTALKEEFDNARKEKELIKMLKKQKKKNNSEKK